MATVSKDFKIKSGLIVEGSNGTINGYDILTKDTADQNYIIGLIGGSATSEATADTVVLRDENADFSANMITSDLTGDVTGTVSDISNHDTNDLSEGSTNKYFTSQRAIDANTGLWDTIGAADDAQTAAESYADGVAGTAESNAKTYTDNLIGDVTVDGTAGDTVTARIATAKSEAITAAEGYTDDAITNLDLSGTYDALGAADQALTDAKAYTDQEVAALVDGAPALLDTLNELAAAIADNPNYATDVANLVATKQDTLAAGTGITIDTNSTISVTANTYDAYGAASTAQGAAEDYADTVAGTAETNAKNYADGLAVNYDAAGAAATALQDAKDYADALDTDDVAEGTSNLYFTTNRAKDAAIALLTGTESSLTNIQITANMAGGVDITAENGVADSTTDDLEEGSSNLYFTNVRAVDALEAVVPNFTEVDLNSVATQVAATTGLVATASAVTAYSFAKADYRSAKFLVKCAYGSHTELSEILLTLDSSDNIAMTEYAIVGTNGSSMSISADVVDASVRLRVTTVNNNSTVNVVGTLLA